MKVVAGWGGMILLLFGLPLLLASATQASLGVPYPAILLAIFLGELVGFSEIISRYRDEPLRASFNGYGVAYFVINGLLALIAFVAVEKSTNVFPAVVGHPYSAAVFAGFGAMAVFRSKIFVFRSEDGKEFPVGPDIVLASVLKVVDRKIDRQRAVRREKLIFDQAKAIARLIHSTADFDMAANFLVVSMSSFQNLSDLEKRQIAAAADTLKKDKDLISAPNIYKAMTLGFALLDITGEEGFSDIVKHLLDYLAEVRNQGPVVGSGAASANPASPAPNP